MNNGPGGFQVVVEPAGVTFAADGTMPLLEAARSAGISIRSACRNGVCEICEGTLAAGVAFDSRRNQTLAAGAKVLLCRAEARSNLVIQIEDVMAAGGHAVNSVTARVDEITQLSHDVYRVLLRMPPGKKVPFHAGQYLAIVLPDTEPAWFSIASAPGTGQLELHIQAGSDWVTAQAIMEHLRQTGQAPLQLPFGKACLAQFPDRELVLVAAGTGFAQMKSILDFVCGSPQADGNARPTAPVSLYWGVRQADDMYLPDLPQQWSDCSPAFRFVPVVGNDEDSEWQGHHDQLADSVLAGGHDWSRTMVIASGSPMMVYTLMDALVAAGLPAEAFYSDVLEYAPR